MFQDEFLDLPVRDLRRRTMKKSVWSIDETKVRATWMWGFYTYTIGIRVAHVE